MLPILPVYYAYAVLVLVLFGTIKPRTALLIAFIGGWLFLPMARFAPGLIPDTGKEGVVSFSILLSVLIFDTSRLYLFRPRWFDLPVFIYAVVAPLSSSIDNGLGLYDGFSEVYRDTAMWLIPYLMGRIYFQTPDDLRALTLAVFTGALIYVPLCLIEMKLAPILHSTVYGFTQHSMVQSLRYGGWRPMVFMQHGLMLAAWMALGVIAGYALWREGTLRRHMGVPALALLLVLFVVAVMSRSANAWFMLVVGFLAVWMMRTYSTRAVLICLVLLPPAYVTIRTLGLWSGQGFVEMLRSINADRAASMQFRFTIEDAVIARSLEKPFFGWGGWGDWIPDATAEGEEAKAFDGMWVIILGKRGLLGMTSLLAMLLLPAVLVLLRPKPNWHVKGHLPLFALATITTLYMVDSLPNAMANPIYMVCAGAVSTLATVTWPLPRPMTRPTHPQVAGSLSRERPVLASGPGGNV